MPDRGKGRSVRSPHQWRRPVQARCRSLITHARQGGGGHVADGHNRKVLKRGVTELGDGLGAAAQRLNDVGSAIGAGTARLVLGQRTLLWEHRNRHEPGTAPGTLNPEPDAVQTSIDVMAWGGGDLVELEAVTPQQARGCLDDHRVTWVNIEGLADVAVLREVGRAFEVHELILEDVVSIHQRGKVERYGDRLFFVTRMARISEGVVNFEQVGIVLAPGVLLTFQEGKRGDSLEPVRQRVRAGADRLRSSGADYLAYALIDAIVDGYFPVLESLGEELEQLEVELLTNPGPGSMGRIHEVKRSLLAMRRVVWPQREALSVLLRDDSPTIDPRTRTYLLDAQDHTIQLMDLLETYRELASGLVDLYLSSASNRLNEVMKVLTVIATIFIPLSFIASVYGMNFDTERSPYNMPELQWYLGYPFALGIMAVVGLSLLAWFYRRGWIGRGPER